MSYYIDIIDMISPDTKLVIEQASASGIILEWSGGDSKDDMDIVGSNIKIDMLSRNDNDAAFVNFFTGDEKRFLVQIKKTSDDTIIWQGHILPDQYSEPYKAVNFFVTFVATCGLGRLKSKYLPDEYYSREKSVIQILCACLNLTGLNMDMHFSPAIENFVNKDWNEIYLDTENFVQSNKKQDAYKILQTLLHDTLCVCYQADNRWYVEGLNIRNLRSVIYKRYNVATGLLVGNVEYNRSFKKITPLVTPIITIIPPYNEITVVHPKTEPSFPKSLSKEVNDGWAIVTGVNGRIHASEWMSNGGLYAKCVNPDYYVVIDNKSQLPGNGNNINYPQDDTQWISLKEKVFISKSQRVKIEFEFGIKRPGDTINNPSDMNLWKNPFKYEVVFNSVVVYSNFGGEITDQEKVIFGDAATAKLSIEHIFVNDGLLDVKIYGPPGTTNINRIEGIIIQNAKIEVIGFVEDEIITDLINGEFTIDKNFELVYGDDKSGYSKGFRLDRLKEETMFFNEIEVPILYGFSVNGKFYSVVQLAGANLIAENKHTTYRGGVLVEILNVVYNFNDGEQMVVETPVLYSEGSFSVKKYAVDDVVDSRNNWIQWTDSVYKIERTSYVKTIANIYRRIFNEAHEKLDVVAKNAVKFNDIILFDYVYEKDFFPLNCSWNLDSNKTTLTLGRSNYKDSGTDPGDENIPPIVIAGDDIYISESATVANISATAYDPDGYISSQKWTKITGGFGDVIDTPNSLETALQNLTEDYYTYQIQVTDNDGASAVDTINIIRERSHAVSLAGYDGEYRLTVDPNIAAGQTITFTGVIYIASIISGTYGATAEASYMIVKNGAVIEQKSVYSNTISTNVTINYVATDVIDIILGASTSPGEPGSGDTAQAFAWVNLTGATFTGSGAVTGFPVYKVVESYSS